MTHAWENIMESLVLVDLDQPCAYPLRFAILFHFAFIASSRCMCCFVDDVSVLTDTPYNVRSVKI